MSLIFPIYTTNKDILRISFLYISQVRLRAEQTCILASPLQFWMSDISSLCQCKSSLNINGNLVYIFSMASIVWIVWKFGWFHTLSGCNVRGIAWWFINSRVRDCDLNRLFILMHRHLGNMCSWGTTSELVGGNGRLIESLVSAATVRCYLELTAIVRCPLSYW